MNSTKYAIDETKDLMLKGGLPTCVIGAEIALLASFFGAVTGHPVAGKEVAETIIGALAVGTPYCAGMQFAFSKLGI